MSSSNSKEQDEIAINNEDPTKPYISSTPDNIFFTVIPSGWRDSIKRFNKSLSTLSFVKKATTPEVLKPLFSQLDEYFECTERGSSVGVEVVSGFINFFSCSFILAVIPEIMSNANYDSNSTNSIVSLACGLGSIVSGIVSNLPIVISPLTPVTIYFSTVMQQSSLSTQQGNMVVVYFGVFFLIMGVVAPIGRFCARIMPDYIQLGTTVGIGLFTVIDSFSLLGLVKRGQFTLLELGTINAQVVIGISAIVIIAWGISAQSKISQISGLVWGTFIWWSSQNLWPKVWTAIPSLTGTTFSSCNDSQAIILIFELFILNLISVFGMCRSLCQLGHLITKDGMVPKGRYLTITVAIMNIFSGSLYGPPIAISAESAAGIKAGARTGLSSVVAGILFCFAVFFGPFFSSIPPAGTSPILFMAGMLLFMNVKYIDLTSRFAVPAYITLTFIPFTNSIIAGLGFGVSSYLILSVITGQFVKDSKLFVNYYLPDTFDVTEKVNVRDDGHHDEVVSTQDSATMSSSDTETGHDGGSAVPMTSTSSTSQTSIPVPRKARRQSLLMAEDLISSETGTEVSTLALH